MLNKPCYAEALARLLRDKKCWETLFENGYAHDDTLSVPPEVHPNQMVRTARILRICGLPHALYLWMVAPKGWSKEADIRNFYLVKATGTKDTPEMMVFVLWPQDKDFVSKLADIMKDTFIPEVIENFADRWGPLVGGLENRIEAAVGIEAVSRHEYEYCTSQMVAN